MSKRVVDDVLALLARGRIRTLDITGGAAELNPHFDRLVLSARSRVDELIVRSNLTVLFEPGKEYLPRLFKEAKIHLICSLPCYTDENVDGQRGKGAFKKSIQALRLLNETGFAREEGLVLDLVYNPTGPYLPPEQGELEQDYKRVLGDKYGIVFDRLLTITNVPIRRFREFLESRDEYEKYLGLLETTFNPEVIDNLMCRTFLTVGFDGKVYDCDFNLALGLALRDDEGNVMTIDRLNPQDLEGKDIIVGEHCLSCTAGSGSSCQGALTR